jgi:hypothetical protein
VSLGSSDGSNSKITQRDVFVAAVSILIAAIGAGLFANSCSAGGGTTGALPPHTSPAPQPDGDAEDDPGNDPEDDPEDGAGGTPVRDSADGLYLMDLHPITGSVYGGNVHLAGTDFTDSVRAEYQCSNQIFGYALDGKWDTFEATLGVTTDAVADEMYRFEIYVDDVRAGPRYSLTKFDTEQVTVDVTGAVELRLHASFDGVCATGYPAWGDARLSVGSS